MYRKAVVEQGFIYDRFREDFINSHTFHDAADADSRNDHKVNLGRIGSLLSIRDDLVRKYSSTSMGPDEFLTCMREFMLESPRMKPRLINLEGYLSDNALKVVENPRARDPLSRSRLDPRGRGKRVKESRYKNDPCQKRSWQGIFL